MQFVKNSLPLHPQSPDGEMVDALVSGASAERRVGSSPILGTSQGVFFGELLFLFDQDRARSIDSSMEKCKKQKDVDYSTSPCFVLGVEDGSSPTLINLYLNKA